MRLLSVLALATAAVAQCPPAQFASFGAGCPGGPGASACVQANFTNPFVGNGGNLVNFALLVRSSPVPLNICSVKFTCMTSFGMPAPATTNVWIYDRPVAGGPPGSILAASTMTVNAVAGPSTALFSPPVVIPAGTECFLVIDNRINMRLPISPGSTIVTHYHSGPPAWSGPFNTQFWNYEISCCSSTGSVPVLTATGTPRLGGSYTVNVARAPALTIAMLFTGFSDTSWLGIPLPLDLTLAGAPGCSLLVPATLISAVTTNSAGNAAVPVSIPFDPTLCQGRIFQQWVIADGGANPLGLALSNGGAGTLGKLIAAAQRTAILGTSVRSSRS